MMRFLAEQEPGKILFDEAAARGSLRKFRLVPAFGGVWTLCKGKKAVAFIEEKARETGVNAIHLEVDRGNDSAFELYRRAGYADHDRFLMTKWLKREQH
jgi:hypothetical protein